jgi:hypothetical protein
MNRYTFVIQVHDNGPSTLENLSTHERIQVIDFAAVGPQIERWLSALHASATSIASAAHAEDRPPASRP